MWEAASWTSPLGRPRDLAVVAVVAMKRERGVQMHVNKEIKKKCINWGEGV